MFKITEVQFGLPSEIKTRVKKPLIFQLSASLAEVWENSDIPDQ